VADLDRRSTGVRSGRPATDLLRVAGLLAAGRYQASASVLAAFTVLQLLVYAGLQVPVGVLLDRVGSRRMVVAGALVMAAGQLVLAWSTSVEIAAIGRALVGPATRPPSSACYVSSRPGSPRSGSRCSLRSPG